MIVNCIQFSSETIGRVVLKLLPGPVWSEMVAPIWIPPRGQIDLFGNYKY